METRTHELEATKTSLARAQEALSQRFTPAGMVAGTQAMRKVFAEHPSEFDPRKALIEARKAAKDICIARFEAFGTAGHAPKIKPIPLETLAKRYK